MGTIMKEAGLCFAASATVLQPGKNGHKTHIHRRNKYLPPPTHMSPTRQLVAAPALSNPRGHSPCPRPDRAALTTALDS